MTVRQAREKMNTFQYAVMPTVLPLVHTTCLPEIRVQFVKFVLIVFLQTIFSQWHSSVLALTSLDKLIIHAGFCDGWSGVGEMAARMLCACATILLSEKQHSVSTVIYQTALQQLLVSALGYVNICHTVPRSLPQYTDGLFINSK